MGKDQQKEPSFGQGLGLGIALLKAMAVAAKKYDVSFEEIQQLIENDSIIYDYHENLIKSRRTQIIINKDRRLFVGPTDGSGLFARRYFIFGNNFQLIDYILSESTKAPTMATELEVINVNRDVRFIEQYPDLIENIHKIAFTLDQVASIWENILSEGRFKWFQPSIRAVFLIKWGGTYGYLELTDLKSAIPGVELLTGPKFADVNRVLIIPKQTMVDPVVKRCQKALLIISQPNYSLMSQYDIEWLFIDENFNKSVCKQTNSDVAQKFELIINTYSWMEIFYDICPEFEKIALTINEALAIDQLEPISSYTTAYLVEQNNRFFVVELKKRTNVRTGKIYKLNDGGALNVNGKHKIVTRCLPF